MTHSRFNFPAIKRRQVLRAGAATALIAPFVRMQRTQAQGVQERRLVLFTHANGAHHSWHKMTALDGDSPEMATGTGFELSDTLENLEPIKDDVVILKHLELQRRGAGNPHFTGGMNMLTGRAPAQEGKAPDETTSLDQAVGQTLVGQTPFSSLSLQVGSSSAGKGGVLYLNGDEVKAQENPIAAYEQLVARIMPNEPGNGEMEARLLNRRSVLDFVTQDVKNVQTQLGLIERERLEQVLEGLREMELSLGATAAPVESCTVPEEGSMDDGPDLDLVSRSHIDLATFALSCGLTRVVALCWGGKEAGWGLPAANVGDWHSQSHYDSLYNGDHAAMVSCEQYLAGQYARLVQQIRDVPAGDGNLLDQSVVAYATTNGETRGHTGPNTPFFLAGNWGGDWETGRVVDCNDQLHGQLLLTLAQGMGLPMTSYGDADYCPGPLVGL